MLKRKFNRYSHPPPKSQPPPSATKQIISAKFELISIRKFSRVDREVRIKFNLKQYTDCAPIKGFTENFARFCIQHTKLYRIENSLIL